MSNNNQVVVHNSEQFRRLCDRLALNEDGLTKILVIVHDDMRDEDFSLLIERLTNNRTVQVLSIGLGLPLRPQQLEALGSVFTTTNGTIKNLRLLNVDKDEIDMYPLWRRSFQGTTLENVCLDGFGIGQNAIESFVTEWNNTQQPRRIKNFHLSEVLINKQAVDAIVNLLSRKELSSFIFRLTKCTYHDLDDRHRIAEALKHSKTVEIFGMEDELDGDAVAAAFGDAIANNHTLNGVMFYQCSDTALPYITKGIVNNHKLLSAKVSGSSNSNRTGGSEEMVQECIRQVNHAINLNTAGRCIMHDYAHQGKPLASLDAAWLVCLMRNLEDNADHAVIYSWIREYSDMFVRWALRGLSRKRPAQQQQSESNPRPRKRSKTCS